MGNLQPTEAACDSYCSNPCSQFADSDDTVDECNDCTDDGSNKCFPGAAGYAGKADGQAGAERTADGGYKDIQVLPFTQLKNDKRMEMVIFHWGGEKGGDELISTLQKLKSSGDFGDYLWFHVDCSTDKGASDFKQENLPMTFSQTPATGIGHFNGGDFNEENFRKWHGFRTGEGWKDGDKVMRLEKDDLPDKLVELSKSKPVFVKMYEEWCSHCKSLNPHFKRSSNEVPEVHFVEIECAKSGGFCDHHFPSSGFPRVRFLNLGATKAHDYKGLTYQLMTKFAQNKTAWDFTQATGFGVEMKQEL